VLNIAPRSLSETPGLADDRFTNPDFSASATVTILPDLAPPRAAKPQSLNRSFDVARNAPSVVIPEPPPPSAPAPAIKASARAIAVAERLKENLTPEMLKSFELFLYVSKADRGPLAQRMYVFRKQKDVGLNLLYDWPASTGREQREVSPRGRSSFTGTPRGYYELDPDRMYRKYTSYSWKQSMPYAMFFNWERQGLQTGLAIHAASGDDIALLGRRASAGCVHLAPEDARTLYELIRGEYRGQVPRFAYDKRTRTMSNEGALMRDAKGRLVMADGYKVLVLIEDYAGDDSIAALF
jgi:lipoprotein-anchoring transpeptidase ErfK/SrfK